MVNKFTKLFTVLAILYSYSAVSAEEAPVVVNGDKIIIGRPDSGKAKETKEEIKAAEEISEEVKDTVEKTQQAAEKDAEKVEEKLDEVQESHDKAIEEEQKKVEEKVKDIEEESKPAEEKSDESKDDEPENTEEQKEETGDQEKSEDAKSEEKENDKKADKIKVASFINSGGDIKVEGISLAKNILIDIYSPRGYKTIWFNGETPNANYEKALSFISLADENGLNRRYYDVDLIKKRVEDEEQTPGSIIKTDVLITHFITEMIQQIGNGQIIPDELKLQTYFKRPVRVTNVAKAFEEFMKADDANEVIEKYSPKNPQYPLLRKALKSYIEKEGERRGLKPLTYSRDIFPGDKDHTISEIRGRVGGRRSVDPNFEADMYDKALVTKVSEFQKKFGQKENGVINKEFIEALNNHDIDSISRIKANMERYRWLPDEMEPTRIEVNLANFTLTAYRDSKIDFSMGAIVGKLDHKTPIMSTKMYQFIMNPYWNVPKAYFLRNMLPLLKQDSNYVKNQNFDLLRLEKEGWKSINQSDINLNSITADNYNLLLRQRPGNLNVLGPIKFQITNPYDIFLHFTSEPWLFTNKFRGYSSGCIRIEDPIKLSKFLIEEGEVDITEEKFDELFKAYQSKEGIALPQKKEYNDKYFKFKKPISTYTIYFTTVADENGNITFYDDAYNLDFDQSKYLGL